MSTTVLERQKIGTLRITRVTKDQPHTLVALMGSRKVYLRFADTKKQVTINELRDYLEGQLDWKNLKTLDVIVDGQRHPANVASTIELAPDTQKVDFNQPNVTTVEFQREAPAKG